MWKQKMEKNVRQAEKIEEEQQRQTQPNEKVSRGYSLGLGYGKVERKGGLS